MTEPAFREIQLTRKQLVFLFMSTVVVLVVTFLLGVSVGQGVGPGQAMDAADAGVPGDTLVATDPSATTPAPGELTYQRDLQGPPSGAGAAAAEPPAPPAITPEPPTSQPPPVTEPVTRPVAPPPPAPDPVTRQATPPATTTPAGQTGGWMIQVGVFGSRENADRLVATLKQRGHTAFITQVATSTAPYSVRVGPFAERADAARAVPQVSRDSGVSAPLIIR
jgi:DedD protein